MVLCHVVMWLCLCQLGRGECVFINPVGRNKCCQCAFLQSTGTKHVDVSEPKIYLINMFLSYGGRKVQMRCNGPKHLH